MSGTASWAQEEPNRRLDQIQKNDELREEEFRTLRADLRSMREEMLAQRSAEWLRLVVERMAGTQLNVSLENGRNWQNEVAATICYGKRRSNEGGDAKVPKCWCFHRCMVEDWLWPAHARRGRAASPTNKWDLRPYLI